MKNKKLLISITLLLIITTLISGCSNPVDEMTGKDVAQIFKIKNSSGEIIENSQLEVKDAKVNGEKGIFKVIMNTKKTYNLIIKADRYNQVTKKHSPSAQSKTTNIKLERRKFNIIGNITSGSEKINKANVEIVSLSESTKTNGEGDYIFNDIPSNKYKVKVTRSGYSEKTKTIDLIKANTEKVEINGEKVNAYVLNFDLNTLPSILEGQLINNSTNQPLEKKDIVIKELDKTITTDSDGRFQVELKPTNYTLVMDYPKFKYKKVNVDVPAGLTKNLGTVPLELPDGGIEGVLYNQAKKSEKIGNALVKINETGETTTSNLDGTFKFNSLNSDTYTLSISHDNFGDRNDIGVTVKSQEISKPEIALTANPANLKGNTLSNVNIDILETNFETTSNNEGDFRINSIPEGNYTVEFSKNHYNTVKIDITLEKDKTKDIGSISLNTNNDGDIKLSIINNHIDNFDKSTLNVEFNNANKSIVLNNGSFTLDTALADTDKLPVGDYQITVNHTNYDKKTIDLTVKPEHSSSNPVSKEITLVPSTRTIEGTVSYSENSLEGTVDVTLLDSSDNVLDTTTTNSSNVYSFSNVEPTNSYKVKFEHNDFQTKEKSVTVNIGDPDNIVNGDFQYTADDIKFGEITGSIVDHNEKSLNATVNLYKGDVKTELEDGNTIESLQTVTDSSFTFNGNLTADDYTVEIKHNDFINIIKVVTITNSNRNVDLGQTILNPKDGSISGKVVDSSGNPLEGVSVTGAGSTTTDSNGNFTLSDVEPDNYSLSFSINGYESESRTLTISPNEDQTISNVSLNALNSGMGNLDIEILNENGSALTANDIDLYDDGGNRLKYADSTNSVYWSDIEEGSYNLKVQNTSGYYDTSQSVTILSDSTSSVTINMTPKQTDVKTGIIKGYFYLTEQYSEPIINAEINIYGYKTTTNSNGYFELELPVGQYDEIDTTRTMDNYEEMTHETCTVQSDEPYNITIYSSYDNFYREEFIHRDETITINYNTDFLADEITISNHHDFNDKLIVEVYDENNNKLSASIDNYGRVRFLSRVSYIKIINNSSTSDTLNIGFRAEHY